MEVSASYETLLVAVEGRIGKIALNRPQALNALNRQTMLDLLAATQAFDASDEISVILISGSEKAFAAGADIRELSAMTFERATKEDYLAEWEKFARIRKPIIAAVSGYALGGGCELMLMCDIVYASPTTRFGLPEVTLGLIPGMGGTQRLARFIGKAKAMDMILTGRTMHAEEAERCGLVSRIIAGDQLMEEATAAAKAVATYSLPALIKAKEAINSVFEMSLAEGLRFERESFHSLFALEDPNEGLQAFLAKRKPKFKNR